MDNNFPFLMYWEVKVVIKNFVADVDTYRVYNKSNIVYQPHYIRCGKGKKVSHTCRNSKGVVATTQIIVKLHKNIAIPVSVHNLCAPQLMCVCGKHFNHDHKEIQTLYPNLEEFANFRSQMDPNKIFVNEFLEEKFQFEK